MQCCSTLYHAIPTSNNPIDQGFGKLCRKRRKCWYTAFFPFPTVFSTWSKREIIILAMFNLSHLQMLGHTKILSFGKELTLFAKTKLAQITFFEDDGISMAQKRIFIFHLWKVNNIVFSDGLLLPHNDDFLTHSRKNPSKNIVGQEENAGKKHFIIFPQCFLSYETQL